MEDTRQSVWRYFILILIIFFLLRLTLFWIPIIDVDESIYALFAKVWFAGGKPYINCVETKPLGIYLFYGIIFKLAGPYNMTAVHIITTLWIFLTSYILYLIVRLFGSHRGGLLAALFYGVFTTTYTPKVIATTIEPIMMLPIALHIYLWLKFEDRKALKYAFLSGISLSAALLLKYQAGINLIIMIIYLFLVHPLVIKDTPLSLRLKGLCYFIIGLIPLSALMIIYLKAVGSLDAFLYWTITGSLSYIEAGSSTINMLRQFLTRIMPFLAATALLWILLWSRVRNLIKIRASRHEWLILLWLILSIVPVAAGRRFYGHYFILILPPLAILAGHQLDLWWQKERSHVLKTLVVIAIVLPAIGCLIPRFFIDKTYKAFGEDNPNDYRPIANYISKHTSKDQRIVVWGFAPLIYWYSERLPATRFFWSDLLAGRVPASDPRNKKPASPLFWEMFFEDMETQRPVYFVDTSPASLHDYEHFPIDDYPALRAYLNDRYKIEATVNKAVVYKRR